MDKQIVALLIQGATKLTSEIIRYRPIKLDNRPTSMQPTESVRIVATTGEKVNRGVSTADTIAYQKEQLVKQITLMEMHLSQGCKIFGKACDCCEKHPEVIEALAEETLGMTGDPLYQEIIAWCQYLKPRTTAVASGSGEFDKEYARYALEGRRLRKALMGSAIIPQATNTREIIEQTSRPHDELSEISDIAHKVQSGEMSKEEAGSRVKAMLADRAGT